MNIYYEGSKLDFHTNCQIDADICKIKALKLFVKESNQFTGRMEDDYIECLNHCIELLDFMKICEWFLIQKDEKNHYRPIKNTSKNLCYLILYQLQGKYRRYFNK